MAYDLDFEKPLAEIEQKILKLRRKAEKLKPEERVQLEAWEAELLQKTAEIPPEPPPPRVRLVISGLSKASGNSHQSWASICERSRRRTF